MENIIQIYEGGVQNAINTAWDYICNYDYRGAMSILSRIPHYLDSSPVISKEYKHDALQYTSYLKRITQRTDFRDKIIDPKMHLNANPRASLIERDEFLKRFGIGGLVLNNMPNIDVNPRSLIIKDADDFFTHFGGLKF